MWLPHHSSRLGALFGNLGKLLYHHVPLQSRDVVDEQPAIEVINFMLQASRHQPVGIHHLLFALTVKVGDLHGSRPFDIGVVFRD